MASLVSGAYSVCTPLIYHNLSIASVLIYYPIYTKWKGQGVSVAEANPGLQVHPHPGTKGWRHVAVAEPLLGCTNILCLQGEHTSLPQQAP